MPKQPAPRPDHVVIGFATYGIEWFEETDWRVKFKGHEGDGGLTFNHSHLIAMRIEPEASEQALREVLVHELLHACWGASMMTQVSDNAPKDEMEEWTTSLLAPVLLFVLQQNDHVMKYLTDGVA